MAHRRHRQKRPTEPVVLYIERLSHEGRGVARLEGKAVFVDNALPGETVRAIVVNVRPQFSEAVATEVLEHDSPDRVEPPCPKAVLCGGCSLQHLHPDAQIRHKQQVLLDQLRHFGGQAPAEVVPPLRAATLGYRTKARLGVRYVRKRDEVLVGFREKHTNFLTDIEACPILVPAVGQRIQELKQVLRGMEAYEAIPQLEIAFGDEQGAIIVRHMRPLGEADLARWRRFAEDTGVAIFLQPQGPDSVERLVSPGGEGDLHYSLDSDLELAFRPTDFTQVNLPMNRLMVSQALSWLDLQAEQTVLDLFCGLGNFTVAIARHCRWVVGVEGSEDMVRRGLLNAQCNDVSNIEFHAANLHAADWPVGANGTWLRPYDRVLLDPPRAGAEEICRQMGRLSPRRIVYVSCNPATLARDSGILADQGYRLKKAGVMDMFPHTTHVESMALFVRE